MKNYSRNTRRLVIVSPFFFPKIGGVEQYAFQMARRFHDDGWKVTVVTSSDNGYTYEVENDIDDQR